MSTSSFLSFDTDLELAEEKALVKFFGDDYIHYRRRVGTKIPFVP